MPTTGYHTPHVDLRTRGPRMWELLAPLTWTGGQGDTITVPAGFVCDLASVPRAVTWAIPPYGAYTRCAVLHDWLCDNVHWGTPVVSRRDADGIFRRTLREVGVSVPRRWMMWAAVRLGGRMSGACWRQWLAVLGIGAVAVPLLAPIIVSVQLHLWAWWLLERLTGKRVQDPIRG